MNKILVGIFLIFSLTAEAKKTFDNNVEIGDTNVGATDITFLFNQQLPNNAAIKANLALKRLQFRHPDEADFTTLGLGTSVGKIENFLKHPSFESGIGDWSNTGGAVTIIDYPDGSPSNKKYAQFVATAGGQKFRTPLITVPTVAPLGGMAEFFYNTLNDDFIYRICKDANCVELAVEDITITASSADRWKKIPVSVFDLSPTTTLMLEIESATAGTITVDKTWLGTNLGMIEGQNLSKWEVYAPTFGAFGTPTDVDFRFMRVGDGIMIEGIFRIDIGGAGEAQVSLPVGLAAIGEGSFQWLAGVYFRHNSAQGSGGSTNYANGDTFINFSSSTVFNTNNSQAMLPTTGQGLGVNGELISLRAYVKVSGLTDNTNFAFVPEQADFFLRAKLEASDDSNVSLSAEASRINVNNTNLTLTNLSGSCQITCAGNPSNGATCSSNDETIGTSCNYPVAGRYEICFDFTHHSESRTNGKIYTYWSVDEVSTSAGSSTTVSGGDGENRKGTGHTNDDNTWNAGSDSATTLCEIVDIPGAGVRNFALNYTQFVAGNTTENWVRTLDSGTEQANVMFTARLISHNVSRPIVQNMVDTKVAKGKRTESCRIDNNGTATVNDASGMCAWVDVSARISLGRVQIDTTAFSKIPNCQCTHTDSVSGLDNHCTYSEISATQFIFNSHDESGGVNQDVDFYIYCEGAR